MIKKLSKVILFFGLFSIILLSFDNKNVEASPHYSKRMINGVTNRFYYIDSSASKYESETLQAIYDWNNSVGSPSTWTPIWLIRTGFRPSSMIDIFSKTMYFYTLGTTEH